MSRRNLLILLLAFAVSYACYMRCERPYARYAAEGLATIEQDSLDFVPSGELFAGAMRGMVGVLQTHGDAHSRFLNAAEANPLRSEIHQQFGGIGVRIGLAGKQRRLAIVAAPDPGGPAARAKLRAGDYILKIDDAATSGMSMSDVLRLVRGEPGSTVRLSIERPSETQPRNVELVREVINIESILGDRRNEEAPGNFAWQPTRELRMFASRRLAITRQQSLPM